MSRLHGAVKDERFGAVRPPGGQTLRFSRNPKPVTSAKGPEFAVLAEKANTINPAPDPVWLSRTFQINHIGMTDFSDCGRRSMAQVAKIVTCGRIALPLSASSGKQAGYFSMTKGWIRWSDYLK